MLSVVTSILVALVAILHIYFLILEMFLWVKPVGLRVFKQTLENAKNSKVLAANQGLYNGFLSAGLIWGLVHPVIEFGTQVQIFFLACVIIAGIYGAATVGKKILFVQAAPAAVALMLIVLSRI